MARSAKRPGGVVGTKATLPVSGIEPCHLFVFVDPAALDSAAIAPTGLRERSNWRRNGASPFRVALRSAAPPSFATRNYCPPYLPPDRAIPVACSNRDLSQPFLFHSPSSEQPDRWNDGRAGLRQTGAGLSEIKRLDLLPDRNLSTSGDLRTLVEAGVMTLGRAGTAQDPGTRGPGIILSISRHDSDSPKRLELPAMRWLD